MKLVRISKSFYLNPNYVVLVRKSSDNYDKPVTEIVTVDCTGRNAHYNAKQSLKKIVDLLTKDD